MADEHIPVMRQCLYPDCTAKFGIVAVLDGTGAAPGWLQSNRCVTGYLCPDHSVVWSDGSHVPRWVDFVDDLPSGAVCSCGGWEWPPASGTAGVMRDSYVRHLVEVDRRGDGALRLLVTGSRRWRDCGLLASELHRVVTEHGGADRGVVLVHGGAAGADGLAGVVAREAGWRAEPHPADWARDGRAAGVLRNAVMVKAGADVCVAFLARSQRNVGTRDCVSRARRAGIPVVEVWGP